MICDVLLSSLDGGSRSWNFQFQRAFHDCELEDMLALFKLIYSKLPSGVGVDGLSWSLTRSGTFDVCTFYNGLCASLIICPLEEHLAFKGPYKGFVLFIGSCLGAGSYYQ